MEHLQRNTHGRQFLQTLLDICADLNPDEIFFWSRAYDPLRALFESSPDEIQDLILSNPKQEPYPGPYIDRYPDKTLQELFHSCLSIIASLEESCQQYWLGSISLLAQLLPIGKVDFLEHSPDSLVVPPQQKACSAEVFNSKKPFRSVPQYSTKDVLLHSYDATDERAARVHVCLQSRCRACRVAS